MIGKITTDGIQFAIDKTQPDAIIADFGAGAIAGPLGGTVGFQLVVFREGDYDNSTAYAYTYTGNNTIGVMEGAGVQVGLGRVNYTNKDAPGILRRTITLIEIPF